MQKLMGIKAGADQGESRETKTKISARFSLFKSNRYSIPSSSTLCHEADRKSFAFSPRVSMLSSQLAEPARKRISSSKLELSHDTSTLPPSDQSLPDFLISSQYVVDQY